MALVQNQNFAWRQLGARAKAQGAAQEPPMYGMGSNSMPSSCVLVHHNKRDGHRKYMHVSR